MKPLFDIERTSLNSEWEVLKIKRVLDTPITDGPHETPELLDEGIPFLSAESVKKGKLDFNLKRGYISREDHEKYIKKCKPQRDDIFMIKSGATTGNVAMVETDEEFSIWSPLALIRADKDKILPKYLYYFIGSAAFREQVEISWSFGTQQNIGMKVIENLFISLPSIDLQKKLVRYMENKAVKIDEVIEYKEKSIRLLEQQRQSIITEAVTKGLNPNVKMKDSGVEWIGEIPEYWEVNKIKFKFDIRKVIQPTENPTVLSLTQRGLKIKDLKDFSGQHAESYDKYQKVEPKDYVMNGMDLLTGYVDCSPFEGVTSPDYRVFRIKDSTECHDYYLRYFQICYFAKIFYGHGQGVSNFGRWRLQTDVFKEFPIPVPPKDEQFGISKFLKTKESEIDKALELIKLDIEKLKEYRQSLIYEAVTGKIDVREIELD